MNCENCGKTFTPSRPRRGRTVRFCSRECGGAGVKRRPRDCVDCGAMFAPTGARQRRCAGCGLPERVCETCGATFRRQRDHGQLRFCSKSCANTASARRGADHPNYNGGLSFSGGRWTIYCRDGSQLLFSRAVMAAHLGRLLDSDEIVHHGNEDTADDRIENLLLTDRSEHARIHDFGSKGWRG